jgi:hypothetical protein
MKKKKIDPEDPLGLNAILKISAQELEAIPPAPPTPVEKTKRLELGYVAIVLKNNKATSGAYTAGAKVYKSEAMARSATRFRYKPNEIMFAKAYAEI